MADMLSSTLLSTVGDRNRASMCPPVGTFAPVVEVSVAEAVEASLPPSSRLYG
jgi:hypothetical protein